MSIEKEVAEIIRPGNLTHYDEPHLKRTLSELLRALQNERREHARELREAVAKAEAQ